MREPQEGIVLASSCAERERLRLYRLHASRFMTEPTASDPFGGMFQAREQFRLGFASAPAWFGGALRPAIGR
jgi:hypothetical protein